MPQSSHDLPPHLRPFDRPEPELQEFQELPQPSDAPPPPYLPEVEAPRPVDPYLRQS